MQTADIRGLHRGGLSLKLSELLFTDQGAILIEDVGLVDGLAILIHGRNLNGTDRADTIRQEIV